MKLLFVLGLLGSGLAATGAAEGTELSSQTLSSVWSDTKHPPIGDRSLSESVHLSRPESTIPGGVQPAPAAEVRRTLDQLHETALMVGESVKSDAVDLLSGKDWQTHVMRARQLLAQQRRQLAKVRPIAATSGEDTSGQNAGLASAVWNTRHACDEYELFLQSAEIAGMRAAAVGSWNKSASLPALQETFSQYATSMEDSVAHAKEAVKHLALGDESFRHVREYLENR